MQVGACSHIGKVREINEDAYCIENDQLKLFIVADGMGGHNAGEIASNIAIHSIKDYMRKNMHRYMNKEDDEVFKVLREAIVAANMDIFMHSVKEKECKGMGTTLTAVLILSQAYIGHVGDSRAYLIQKNKITQITKDHSLVGELVRNGSITESEAKIHPQRNIITRALGTEENVNIDLCTVNFEADDMIVLCTDGLSNMIEGEEIKNTLIDCKDIQLACEQLVALANERGGTDNITMIGVRKR
jgi:serine/threonine protein phosphatase PrpC